MLNDGESVLGLDITHKGIKIVELKKTGQGIELVAVDTIPLLADSTKEEGFSIEPKYIATVLTEFLQGQNISARKAFFVVNPPHIVTRLIRLPFVSSEDMRANLESEVNQYADFKDKQKVIDFCRIEEINEEGTKKVNVLFAAVFQKTVDYFSTLARLANLELQGIESGSLAIIRLLSEVNLKADSLEPVMLIIINTNEIQLCVLKGNRLRFLHAIKTDIEKISGPEKEDFINKLIIAVKLALNYYEMSSLGGESVLKIVVSPNDILAKDIDRELSDKLTGLSVEKGSHLGRLHIDKNNFKGDFLENINLTHAQAIGAALKIMGPADYPLAINLLCGPPGKMLAIQQELPLYASSLGTLLTLYLVISSIFSVNIWFIQRGIAGTAEQLKKTDISLKRVTSGLSQKENAEEKIVEGEAILTRVRGNQAVFWSELLAETMLAVPDELWISDISANIKDGAFTLGGRALLEKPVFDYVNILANNKKYFNSAELVSSQTEGDFLRFLIKCKLKR